MSKNLLRTAPTFRRYWAARAVSLVGDGSAAVALLLYVAGGEDAGAAVGLLLVAQSLPRFLGPLAGALADRLEQRRLMVVADLGQAALYGVLAVTLPPVPVVVAVVLVATTLGTTFDVAGRSTVPAMVDRDDLMAANGWLGTAVNLQVAVGPVLGGALVALVGVRGALVVDVATFLVSAALVARLPPMRAEGAGAEPGMRAYLADVADGLRYVRHHRVARQVAILLFGAMVLGSLDNVALVFLARDVLGAGSFGFGVLAGAFGAAMVAASLLLVRPARARRPSRVLLGGWALIGTGVLLTGLAPTLAVAAAAQAVGGVGNGFANVARDTLVQQTVDRRYLGRVYGVVGSASFLGSTLAYVVGGFVLVDLLTPRQLFVLAGAGVVAVVALVATRLTPEAEDAARARVA